MRFIIGVNEKHLYLSITDTWNISVTKMASAVRRKSKYETTSFHTWQVVTSHTPSTAVLPTSLVFVFTSAIQLQLPYSCHSYIIIG